MDTNDPLDLERFRAHVGDDDELVRELLGVYAENSASMRGNLERAVASGDANALMRAAHAIKGALLTLCANPSARLAESMERAGRGGDAAAAIALWPALEHELSRLDAFVAAHQ